MRNFLLSLFLSLCLMASPSFADVDNQIEMEDLLSLLRDTSETAAAFAEISKLGAAELKDLNDEEILTLYEKRPDSPVLAIEAATRHLRAERTDQALQIVETLNIVYPTIPALRAFYGTLLVKSQRLREAREQLLIIQTIAETSEDREAAKDLQSLIDQEARPDRLSGFVSLGLGYTDNAGLEEDGKESLLARSFLSLDGTHRLGEYGAPHALFGGAYAIGVRPLNANDDRISVVGASAGHQYRLGSGAIVRSLATVAAIYDADGNVRKSPGLSLRYRHVAISGRSTTARLRVRHDYYDDPDDQGADGWAIAGRFTSSHPLGNSLLGSISASIEREDKDTGAGSEWGGILAGSLTVPIAQGFLRGAVIGRLTKADSSALSELPTERTKNINVNIDFSVPTKNLIEGAPEGLGQRVSAGYTRSYSNLDGGDYSEKQIMFSTFYRF